MPWTRPGVALGAATAGWNFALGLTHIVLPLYAVHLGLDALQVGLVLGAPVAVQLALGLFGGAAADRWGGRNILIQAMVTMALGGLACIAATDFWSLLAAQLFFTYSRGVFWPASQSIAAALPGDRAVHLGRLNALTSMGQISGTASAGALVAWAGYAATFGTFAAVAVAAMGAAWALPGMRPQRRADRLFAHFAPLARRRAIWFALLAAFLCAQPVSLSQSFFPILLRELGFAEPAVGPLLALRPLGAAAATLVLARLLGSGAALATALAAGAGLGACLFLTPLAGGQALAAGTLIVIIGVCSGLLLVYYQMVIAAAAPAHARGSALALGGLGWGLSHLTGPFLVGAIAQRWGLAAAFQVWAGVTLMLAGALWPAHRWARADFARPDGRE